MRITIEGAEGFVLGGESFGEGHCCCGESGKGHREEGLEEHLARRRIIKLRGKRRVEKRRR